jgi:hypothetical protein
MSQIDTAERQTGEKKKTRPIVTLYIQQLCAGYDEGDRRLYTTLLYIYISKIEHTAAIQSLYSM